MKKSLLASAVFLVFNVAHAQTPGPAMVAPPSALTGPAVTTSVTTTTTAPGANTAVTATPNGAAVTTTTTATPVAAGMDVNPFTGVPKSEVETRRIEQDLKRQRVISSEKLSLQRDSLESLKIEQEKQKILDDMRRPPSRTTTTTETSVANPVKAAVKDNAGATTPGSATATTTTTVKTTATPRRTVRRAPARAPAVAVARTPATAGSSMQVISPSGTSTSTAVTTTVTTSVNNSSPELLGTMDVGGQKIALINYQGQKLQARVGSTVAGQQATQIGANTVRLGNQTLTTSSAGDDIPTIAITDKKSGSGSGMVSVAAAAPTPVPAVVPVAAPGMPSPLGNQPIVLPGQQNNYPPPTLPPGQTLSNGMIVNANGLPLPPPPAFRP